MRTRSVQLVTSWWVVCVWAALSLATGLVSVVAVLQPAWYVRYSQIHAQDAQGVAFQVMVSSVGPLGYCRLAGVSQVTVPGEDRQPNHDGSNVVLRTTPAPLWTSVSPSFPGASEHPLNTLEEGVTFNQAKTETQPKTQPPWVIEDPATTTDSSEGKIDNSNEEGTAKLTETATATVPINITASTTTNVTLTPSTSVSNLGSHYSEKPISSSSQTTTTTTSITVSITATENSVTAEANRSVEITTPGSLRVGDPSEADAVETNFMPLEPTTTAGIPGMPREENKSERVKAVTPTMGRMMGGSGESGGSVRKHKKNRKKFTQLQIKATGSVTAVGKNVTTASKGRKKGKYRRRKKKNRRKRPRDRNGKKIIGRSHGRGAPRPDPPLHHLLRSRLDGREDPQASPLLQPRTKQEKLISSDYQPRPPILYCSGVGGGVGSGSSAVWALVGVLYGVAGVVQVAVGVASLVLHLPHAHTHAKRYIFAAWLGNVQVAIVMSQGVALVLFPLGLGSPLARGECGGSSSVYWPGECSFGWSYMLGVVATTLAAYCPCLARLTVFRRYDYKEWDSINFF